MDLKGERQRVHSMINDYNAYKSTGGGLYEISVETDTDAEFICKGVLRLYWDIQRPIVLNKEATSSFVQKRERSTNIVARPPSRKKSGDRSRSNSTITNVVHKKERSGSSKSAGVSQIADDAFDNDNITDISHEAKPSSKSPTQTMFSSLSHGSGSGCADFPTNPQGPHLDDTLERLPVRKLSSDGGLFSRSPPASKSTHTLHGLDLQAREAELSGNSPHRSKSFCGGDKKQRQTVPDKRRRCRSSLGDTQANKEAAVTGRLSGGDAEGLEISDPIDNEVRSTTSSGCLAATLQRGKANGSNFSRMLTSSFKRPKSPRPHTASQLVMGPHTSLKPIGSGPLLDTPQPTTPGSLIHSNGGPRPASASPPSSPVPPSSSISNRRSSTSENSPGPVKRKRSFRKGFRNVSPKRRPITSHDTVDSQDGRDSLKETSSESSSEKSGSRLGTFWSRPLMSFRLRRNVNANTSSVDSVTKEEHPPPKTVDAESLAEFYQPPKGSVTNVRATSNMTVLDVISATLSKLNAVDEPTRFAIFAIDDRGTVKMIQDEEWILLYRIRLGPKETVCKLFIMERDTNDAQDFSVEVMQYYHLGMPFLERLVKAYEDEEEREIERVRLKFADNRRRLEKKLAKAIEDLKAAGEKIPQ